MAYRPIKLSKSEIKRIARGGKPGRSLNCAEQIAICREYRKLGIEAKRVEGEIIEGSDAQQEAYREMDKCGWKPDKIYETEEERRDHRAEKREAKREAAQNLLRQLHRVRTRRKAQNDD